MPSGFRSIVPFCVILFLMGGKTFGQTLEPKSRADAVGMDEEELKAFTKGEERSVEELYGDSVLQKLKAMTPDSCEFHPEFGVLPHNTQCDSCLELIHKRTKSTRRFVGLKDPDRIFIQRSYGDLHYKDEEGRWISIDPYLEPQNGSEVLTANAQPVPVRIHPQGYSLLEVGGFEYRFNRNVSLHSMDQGGQTQKVGDIDLSQSNEGSDGVYTIEAFDDIHRKQIVELSGIKTSYILDQRPSSLDTNSKALVFQDVFQLPTGYEVVYDSNSAHTSFLGGWVGDLVVQGPQGQELVRWKRPSIFDDGRQNFLPGAYRIEQNGNEWKVQLLVDGDWLRDTATYPVTVDPLVTGSNTYSSGEIRFSQFQDDGSGICGNSLDYCAGSMTVTVPGQSEIQDVIWELDLETKNSTLCGGFFSVHQCVMDHGLFEVVGPCGSSGRYCQCPPPNQCCCYGTCTPGPYSEPFLADCQGPQCPDYNLTFELHNIHCRHCASCGSGVACSTFDCEEYCHYIPNNSWTITVEARTVEGNLLANGNSTSFTATCSDTPVTLEANPDFGVSSYSCEWSKNGNPPFSNSCVTDVYPTYGTWNTYTLTITDDCGNTYTESIDIYGDCSGVLPVELLTFEGEAKRKGVRLDWVTGSEQNSDHFTVLRRGPNEERFHPIGEVDAAGTSVTENEYSFWDRDPPSGTIYYRLKQVDKDSSVRMSSPVAVKYENSKLDVYPLPADEQIQVKGLHNARQKGGLLKLYDVHGRMVRSYDLDTPSEGEALTLSLEGIPSGIYFLSWNGEQHKVTVK